ncbi:MAG: hypothetical protein IKN36_08620, partial [Clostridia bacterium]|nr:hypothetical protein [Clostridia bacterium]
FSFAAPKRKVAKEKGVQPAVKTSMFLTPAAHVPVRPSLILAFAYYNLSRNVCQYLFAEKKFPRCLARES